MRAEPQGTYLARVLEILRQIDSLLLSTAGGSPFTSGTNLFISLFNNLAVFIFLVIVYGFLSRRLRSYTPLARQVVMGIAFGVFVYGCMHVKIPVAPGVQVDQRNAVIILAGLFGGPIAAALSAAAGISYRIYLGGVGVLGGSLGMMLSAAAGIVLRRFGKRLDTPWKMGLASLASAIFVLPGFLPIGSLAEGWKLMMSMAVPYGSAITVGVLFGSLLLKNEEKQREAAISLSESEKRYRELFESLIDASYRIDEKGRFIVISPSARKVFGYDPSEMVGNSFASFVSDPGKLEELQREFERTGRLENAEVDIQGRDGKTATISFNARKVVDDSGRFLWTEGVARDITQARKNVQEKARLEEVLRQSQKMQAIGQLAGGIAHDFNNMLSGIIGFTEVASTQIPADHPAAESLTQVLGAAERARRLVERILTFSRGAAVEMRAARLRDVLVEALNLIKMTMPAAVVLAADLGEESGTVLADATQIHEAIVNIATNGIHAMNGTGVLTVSLKEKTFDVPAVGRIGTIGPGRFSLIEIRDTGTGMDKALMDKAFEPFFTTKPPGEGTGMGLSVVYGIMKGHGGDIIMESEPGKGTTVTLFFPQWEGKSAEESSTEAETPCGSERILFVDDEPMIASLTESILSSLGYQVTALTEPRRAMEILRRDPHACDILVTDHNMPGMTGLELAREALAANPDLPVILCTGYSSPVGEMEALAAGVRRICMKPIRKHEMAVELRRVLDGRG